MHATLQLIVYWAVAFFTLGLAVFLLNIFFGIIGKDFELHGVGAEAAIAGLASLVEAASVLALLSLSSIMATRALAIPALIVALIYKIAHLEDWDRFDVLMLLFFQIVIGCFGVSLAFGQFQTAFIILVGFAAVLAVIASFAKSF